MLTRRTIASSPDLIDDGAAVVGGVFRPLGASGNLDLAVERGVYREWPIAAGVDLRSPTTFIKRLRRFSFLSIRETGGD